MILGHDLKEITEQVQMSQIPQQDLIRIKSLIRQIAEMNRSEFRTYKAMVEHKINLADKAYRLLSGSREKE